jgi:predicted DNA-binding transcriptional regulator AlpA
LEGVVKHVADADSQSADNDRYVCLAEVSKRYGGKSVMTIWRWQRDLGFPKPVKLGGRQNFWWLPDLIEWDQQRASAVKPKVQWRPGYLPAPAASPDAA